MGNLDKLFKKIKVRKLVCVCFVFVLFYKGYEWFPASYDISLKAGHSPGVAQGS